MISSQQSMQMRPRQKGMSRTTIWSARCRHLTTQYIASDRRRLLTSFRGEEPDLAAAAAIFTSTTLLGDKSEPEDGFDSFATKQIDQRPRASSAKIVWLTWNAWSLIQSNKSIYLTARRQRTVKYRYRSVPVKARDLNEHVEHLI